MHHFFKMQNISFYLTKITFSFYLNFISLLTSKSFPLIFICLNLTFHEIPEVLVAVHDLATLELVQIKQERYEKKCCLIFLQLITLCWQKYQIWNVYFKTQTHLDTRRNAAPFNKTGWPVHGGETCDASV